MADINNILKRPATGPVDEQPEAKLPHVADHSPISFAVSLKGERDELQDAHLCFDDFKDSLDFIGNLEDLKYASYYCLCDGHSGSRAALAVKDNLHVKLKDYLKKSHSTQKPKLVDIEADIKKATIEAYKSIDEDFLKKCSSQKPPWKDGTTVTNLLILNKYLFVANVGDSRAVLFRRKKPVDDSKYSFEELSFLPIPLTRDHVASSYEERQRIQKLGGYVKDGRVLGILEVSRSIGDGPFKGQGVICIPEVKRLQLTADDYFVILACDGLWKVMEVEEVASVLGELCKEESKDIVKSISQNLAATALRKLSGDNVTVITVDLRPITVSF